VFGLQKKSCIGQNQSRGASQLRFIPQAMSKLYPVCFTRSKKRALPRPFIFEKMVDMNIQIVHFHILWKNGGTTQITTPFCESSLCTELSIFYSETKSNLAKKEEQLPLIVFRRPSLTLQTYAEIQENHSKSEYIKSDDNFRRSIYLYFWVHK
jgi:hypothetical protein